LPGYRHQADFLAEYLYVLLNRARVAAIAAIANYGNRKVAVITASPTEGNVEIG
jgi:hypothetical protein